MTLTFPLDLYAEAAVDEACRTFEGYLACSERRIENGSLKVDAALTPEIAEQTVLDELFNFALGLTIERSGATKG